MNSLISQLETNLPELMKKAGVVGLSLSLVQDAQGIWSQAFGYKDRELGQRLGTDTVFEAASLTKPIFATLVLQLAQEGLLSLDAPLSDYLPEPYLPDEPRLPSITARRVLSHTPGFPNWRPKDEPLRIHFNPGERFSYSGEGYVYLQRVVEGLTGQGLAELLHLRLFEPLGMHSSRLAWQDDLERLAARAYDAQGEPKERGKITEANAAYSLYCTPADYARFLSGILQPVGNAFPLQADLVNEMLRPQVPVNDLAPWNDNWPNLPFTLNERVSWGLGWGVQHGFQGEEQAFFHWGDNGPFQSFTMGFRRQKLGILMMSNSQNALKLWQDILWLVTGRKQPAIAWLYGMYEQI